jgi:hypothetical protein
MGRLYGSSDFIWPTWFGSGLWSVPRKRPLDLCGHSRGYRNVCGQGASIRNVSIRTGDECPAPKHPGVAGRRNTLLHATQGCRRKARRYPRYGSSLSMGPSYCPRRFSHMSKPPGWLIATPIVGTACYGVVATWLSLRWLLVRRKRFSAQGGG